MTRKSKEATKAYKAKWKAEKIAAGLCLACGTAPVDGGKKNCRSCLDVAAEKARLYRAKLRREVIHAYGGVCVCCGETELKFLTIDHIGGGGREHRRTFVGYDYHTSGAPFYGALKKAGYPKDEGLQVLCWNCNVAKYHYSTCPHQAT